MVIAFDLAFDEESGCRRRMLKGVQERCADAHEDDELEYGRVELSSLHEAEQVEPFMNRFLHDVEIGVFRERAK